MKYLVILLSFIILSCTIKNKNDKKEFKQSTIKTEEPSSDSLQRIFAIEKSKLIDTLNKYSRLDSCEFFYENSVLKTGFFLHNKIKYGIICLNGYQLLLFEYSFNKWNLTKELNYQMDYRGILTEDIDGDNKNELIFLYFYVYANTDYLVFNLIDNKLIYNESYEGVMNPEFDSKTGLITSCFVTNHGGNEKSTYKLKDRKLIPFEKVILKGAGIEDIYNKNFEIEYYLSNGNSYVFKSKTNYSNRKKAFDEYDKLLFSCD